MKVDDINEVEGGRIGDVNGDITFRKPGGAPRFLSAGKHCRSVSQPRRTELECRVLVFVLRQRVWGECCIPLALTVKQ
jgi:hypothetical protein